MNVPRVRETERIKLTTKKKKIRKQNKTKQKQFQYPLLTITHTHASHWVSILFTLHDGKLSPNYQH